MERKKLIIGGILILVVVGAIVGGVLYFQNDTDAQARLVQQLDLEGDSIPGGGLLLSGFIEAEEVTLSSQTGGRVVDLPFEEGETVESGDLLLAVDSSLLDAQRDAMEAQVEIAESQRDLIAAGPRDEYIQMAQGQVTLAQASMEAARVAWADALMLYSNPQELEIRLLEAETQVNVAREQLTAAQWQLKSAQRAEEIYWDTIGKDGEIFCTPPYGCREIEIWLPYEGHLAPQRTKEAQTNFSGAQEALAGAEEILAILSGYASNPAGLLAQAADAEAAFNRGQAALETAQAELEKIKAGPRSEDLEVVDAHVEEAKAGLGAIETQIEQMSVYAPITGVILQQAIHIGELALPGVPVITIANLETVELTVYVPTTELGRIELGQELTVTVDALPGKTFDGVVTYIADEYEFTPRNVQTEEERVNLVYAVRITIDNSSGDLKPGMPADVIIN